MSNRSKYKYCIVPMCTNTTVNTPEKNFFTVPKNAKIREIWSEAMKRDMTLELSGNSSLYCCEDHFHLPTDMENYYQFQLMPGVYTRKSLKRSAIPHIFECQRKRKITSLEAETSDSCSKVRITGSSVDMVQIKNGFDEATPEQEKHELWNRQFEFVEIKGCAVQNIMDKDKTEMIKKEIKQEELDIPCDCNQHDVHDCNKIIDNVGVLYYKPIVKVIEQVHDLKAEFNEES